jgi:hypothetical protein
MFKLYKQAVMKAFRNLGEDLCEAKCEEVRYALCVRRERLGFQNVEQPALDLHRQEVQEMPLWKSLQTNATCLFCLMRAPHQHVLLCGHALCDICVKLLGKPCMGEYCYEISNCPFCSRTANFRKFLKPPTCGIRVLSLDGGGIRGVISLEYVLLLQANLAESFKLRFLELFDLVVATSAGV